MEAVLRQLRLLEAMEAEMRPLRSNVAAEGEKVSCSPKGGG
jgi:hypothetical protein